MNQSIKLRELKGTVRIPASKSMTQRVYAAALLHRGSTAIYHYGNSEDELAALNIISQLGADISYGTDHMLVRSTGVVPVADHIDCGESGLSARLFTPIAALSAKMLEVRGSGTLPGRSMAVFGDVLPQLGVALPGFQGHIPFMIQGPLQAASLQADGAMSSQFISGLLFALSHAATAPLTLTVNDLASKPYIDLSLEVLQHFGHQVRHDNYTHFYISPQAANSDPVSYTVEGDWSSAAFWLAAAAINGNMVLQGLNEHSLQADRQLLDIVRGCGAQVHWQNGDLHIRSGALRAFDFNATDAPDLFPVLAVLAASAAGESSIAGIGRLRHKESDRAASISAMLDQLGVDYHIREDILYVSGQPGFRSATINSYHDHRMVMAAALASLRCEAGITIEHAESVAKSYPSFFTVLEPFCG